MIRTYLVTVFPGTADEHTTPVSASSPAQAKYRYWREASEWWGAEFGEAMRHLRVRVGDEAARRTSDRAYDYVRRYYDVDVHVGDRVVLTEGDYGAGEVVTPPGSSSAYVYVEFDRGGGPVPCHPASVRAEVAA